MSTQSSSKPKSPKSSKPQKHPNNIRTAVQRSPWTFKEVAEKTNIPRDTLTDYCAGKYPVPHERLLALSGLLNCLPEYLVPPLPNIREAYWSQSQYEATKDLEALLLLRTHCHLHPTDENALQQLMELLAKVGRYQEIEKWFERFRTEVKKEDVWRTPDADTSALLARLRAECALAAPSTTPEKGGQTAPTDEKVAKEKGDSSSSLGEPTLSPDPGLPHPPSNPNPQASGTRSDTIVIQTPQVQIVVQKSLDETPSGITPSVVIASPSFLDPTTKNGRPPSPDLGDLASSSSHSVSPQGIILTTNAPSFDAKNLRDSYLTSSTDMVPSLKVYSTHCQGEVTTCRQQIDIYETIEQRRTMNEDHIINPTQITQRDLFTLAVVSPSLLTNLQRGWPPAGVIEEFLSEVTASVNTSHLSPKG